MVLATTASSSSTAASPARASMEPRFPLVKSDDGDEFAHIPSFDEYGELYVKYSSELLSAANSFADFASSNVTDESETLKISSLFDKRESLFSSISDGRCFRVGLETDNLFSTVGRVVEEESASSRTASGIWRLHFHRSQVAIGLRVAREPLESLDALRDDGRRRENWRNTRQYGDEVREDGHTPPQPHHQTQKLSSFVSRSQAAWRWSISLCMAGRLQTASSRN